MSEDNSSFLFNLIAPVYGLFYYRQKKRFAKVLENAKEELNLSSFHTILDVGCGTGSLCGVLNEKGLAVTGIEPAKKMYGIAKRNAKNTSIKILKGNVLKTLPFTNKSFDIVIASYVAHGLCAADRMRMYIEMSRVTKHWVVIYDYNAKRSIMTTIIEWLEGGDYFRFIKNAEDEMKICFSEVRVVNVDDKAAWYLGKA